MAKADTVAQIHEQAGVSIVEAAKLVDYILEFLRTTLQSGESINISGFGKFTVRN